MVSMTKLSIIILSYNTKELIKACIESIGKQYKKELENGEFEIIVVDNASTDAVESVISNLKKQISNLTLVRNKENFGFSKGNNIGATYAKGEYLFFLNSDTSLKDKGLLGMMMFLDTNREIGILGARLTHTDGTPQASAGVFYNLFQVFLMLIGGERMGLLRNSPKEVAKVDWVSGAAMMVKKQVFEKLGGFDEAFFMYVEDMELCFRAKKQGVLTYFYPNATVVHKELGSSNRSFAVVSIYKGLLYFYKKHTSYIEYLLVKLLLLAKASIAIAIGVCTNNTYLVSTYKKAIALP